MTPLAFPTGSGKRTTSLHLPKNTMVYLPIALAHQLMCKGKLSTQTIGIQYVTSYWKPDLTCSQSWSLCNPENDLGDKRPLQRGDGSTYLPNIVEVMIAIAAPSYDAYMTKRNVLHT